MVKPKTNSTFSKDEIDWMWLRPNVPKILTEIYKKGYAIVIFTNQSKSHPFKIKQIINVFTSLKLPVNIFIETDKSFKKPNAYMYNLYINKRAIINKNDSFYVGDALGRPGDFADSDKQFIINCNIKYLSPEEIFPFIKESNSKSLITIPDYREIILMMGYPAVENLLLLQKILKNHPYILFMEMIINRKVLKKAFKLTIEKYPDKSIILDATHSNKKTTNIYRNSSKRINTYTYYTFDNYYRRSYSIEIYNEPSLSLK